MKLHSNALEKAAHSVSPRMINYRMEIYDENVSFPIWIV